jgi:hypothetical protein
LAEPIKNRTSAELLRAFQVMERKLTARGLQPKLARLDNEASQLLKSYLHDKNITFKVVPPYSHRRNASERAMRSFKDHLIAGICSTDKAFPMHMWDRFFPQAVITLNMLRISRINPKLSASTHIDGYICYTIYITKTRSERVVETVDFPPQKYHYHLHHPRSWQPMQLNN